MRRGLDDPISVVKTVNTIVAFLAEHGNEVVVSNDMRRFQEVRTECRDERTSPMFDYEITELDGKAFWVGIKSQPDKFVGLQACRIDYVDTSLAEWAVGWMSGLYLKRDLLMVPSRRQPYPSSRAFEVHGRLVYHGELWIEPSPLRGIGVASAFCFLGMVLAHMRWQPDAVWALVSNKLATSGHPIRFGYPRVERSFLNWSWSPDDVPNNEWLLLAEFADMENRIAEYAAMGAIVKGA